VRYALTLAVALVLCGVADGGAFPGRNGSIVFGRAGADPQPALVAVDPATGAQRTLGAGSAPAWSSDGSKLAYVRDGTVYVSNADGSGEAAVGGGDFPAWAPGGDRIVVSRYDGVAQPNHPLGTLQLVLLDLAAGTALQLTDGTEDAVLPAWSPDGTTIAFATPTSLETIPAAGGTPTAVPVPTTIDGGPSWSPDGSTLAFVDAGGQVWTTRPDGSGAKQLTYTLAGPAGVRARAAWAPDGTAIAWTSGADLCVTDLAGAVRRVTRTAQATASVTASLPDWQASGSGGSGIFAAPQGPSDSISCDWNPGVRIEVLEGNVSPNVVSVKTPGELVFVNHLTGPVTVTTTMHGATATVAPGRFATFATQPGTYDFVVSGYPDGVPRRGTFVVAAAGRVAIDQHAAIRFGSRTVLTGTAAGPAGGTVTVTARAYGAHASTRIASLKPTGGHWRLSVAPAITTSYQVSYEGATSERLLRVMPDLRVGRAGSALRVSVKPAKQLAGKTLFVFRLRGGGWSQYRSVRAGRDGVALVRSVPPGRYYVGFEGGDAFWGTASEPFTVRR
jgi:Tol biopolymer transport system component